MAFLDRDGVINVDTGYVHRWKDFNYIPQSVEAMKCLASRDIGIVIVTNQAGIARGLYSEKQYVELRTRFLDSLAQLGISVMGIYHCPHHPDGVVPQYAVACDCRKPQPGMLVRAAQELNIDLSKAFLVGDKLTDIQAAHAAGVSSAYLVGTSRTSLGSLSSGTYQCYQNLWECVRHMTAN